MRNAIAYIDGSGNSTRIQACAAVLHVDGVRHIRTKLLPPSTTNNVGEYSGLLLAIDLAKELGVEVLHVHSDSFLIVNQVSGKWRCKNDSLRTLLHRVRENSRSIRLSISWVPREQNTEADAWCRKVIETAGRYPDNPFLRAAPDEFNRQIPLAPLRKPKQKRTVESFLSRSFSEKIY